MCDYCYNNDEWHCDEYGALYQWNEMMDYASTEGAQGICPTGWHIPTDDEWKILCGIIDTKYGSGDPEWNKLQLYRIAYDIDARLKDKESWSGSNPAFDSHGFSALASGYRQGVVTPFHSLNVTIVFWTSTTHYQNKKLSRRLSHFTDAIGR